jgi:uncharacterized RDD family membrane protein YckC
MDPANAPNLPPSAGPAASLVYADVGNRVIAYVIDLLVIAVFNIVVGIVLGIIGIAVVTGTGGNVGTNLAGSLIYTFLGLVISGVYFVYSWTNQRATLGMKALNLQIGNAPEGATITTEQAIRRWLALGAIFSIAQVLNPLPFVGLLLVVAAIAWVIFLLYTTSNSPTKQGWHDKFANTMIVKSIGGPTGQGQPRPR